MATQARSITRLPSLPRRSEQAAQRRRQLLLIASALIEEGGVEAASLAALSERAGCTRPLLYRYFKSKEDLLVALVDDYYERVDAQISEAEQRRVLGEVSTGGAEALRTLIGRYWDAMDDVGLGGPIVRCTPHYSERLRALAADSRERHEARFIEPWVDAGLPRLEAETAVDALLSAFVSLALKARRGEVDREQAIDLIIRIQASQFGVLDNEASGDPVSEN